MMASRDSPFGFLSPAERSRLSRESQPSWTSPMLAVLTHEVFSDPDWIFERKLDGERCLAFRRGNSVRILSRNRKLLNHGYPELEEALREQDRNFVADGEIVAFEDGRTSFSRLQKRMQIQDPEQARRSGVKVYLYLFDILHLSGRKTASLSQRARKEVLRRGLRFQDPLRYVAHRNRTGKRFHREACRKGWEGLIAKQADAPYAHKRSSRWLKFKCSGRQELVIGGFTEPQGSRTGIGAVLVGYYESGDLRYAGKVGTGFDDEELGRLRGKLSRLERKSSPFDDWKKQSRGVHWVTPKLVGEFGFTEWTPEGRLRHPRYLGLRKDKKASRVVREKPREESP